MVMQNPLLGGQRIPNPSLPSKVMQDYVPGQVIVKFNEDVSQADQDALLVSIGASISYTSPYAGFHVVQLPEGTTVPDAVGALSGVDIVDYAEPNLTRRASPELQPDMEPGAPRPAPMPQLPRPAPAKQLKPREVAALPRTTSVMPASVVAAARASSRAAPIVVERLPRGTTRTPRVVRVQPQRSIINVRVGR